MNENERMFFFRKKNKEPKSTLILQPIGHWLNGDKKITRTKTDAWSCQAANLLHDLSFSGLLLSRLYVTLCHRLHPHHSSFFFCCFFHFKWAHLHLLFLLVFLFLFFCYHLLHHRHHHPNGSDCDLKKILFWW